MKKILLILVAALFSINAFATIYERSVRVTVTTTPQYVNASLFVYPATVTVIPNGSTATVEFSTTPNAYSSPGTATWQTLGLLSSVTANNTVTLPSKVMAIRFTRVSGATSVYGEVNWE